MEDKRISALTDGGAVQATDNIPVERGGGNRRVQVGDLAAGNNAGDVPFTSSQGIAATDVEGALDELKADMGALGSSPVDSVVGQTGEVSAAQIKTAVDALANTNFLTDAERTKLTSVESSATADQTDSEIETAYNNQVAAASQAEAEAGTETEIRRFSPLRIKQAIDANASGAGISENLIDAKGDLVAGSADNIAARVAVGADGLFLKADSGAAAGISWATAPGAGSEPNAPDVVITSATTVAETKTAMQAGGWVHFQNGADQDWATFGSDVVFSNDLLVTADDGVTINLAGTDEALSPRHILPKASVRFRGLTFTNGACLFTLEGLDTTVDTLEISDCKFFNVGAAIQHNSITGISALARVSNLVIRRNVCGDSNSFLHLRIGDGSASGNQDMRVDFALIEDNVLYNLDKYGIWIAYDDGLGTNYPSESYAICINNSLANFTGASGSTVAGGGINLTAYETSVVAYNKLSNIQNGDRDDFEGIYNKGHTFYCLYNTLVDAGESQGCIACKGGGSGIVKYALIKGNTIISTGSNTIESAFWYQCDNIVFEDNFIEGQYGNAAVSGQTSISFINHVYRNNDIILTTAPSFNAGLHVRGNVDGLIIEDNRIRVDITTGTVDAIKVRAGGGLTIDNSIVQRNKVYKDDSGTVRGTTYDFDTGGGALSNARHLDNIYFDLDVGVRLEDQAIALISEGNRETNVTTNVNNASSSTVTTETTF